MFGVRGANEHSLVILSGLQAKRLGREVVPVGRQSMKRTNSQLLGDNRKLKAEVEAWKAAAKDAILRGYDGLLERALKAEARVRELEDPPRERECKNHGPCFNSDDGHPCANCGRYENPFVASEDTHE